MTTNERPLILYVDDEPNNLTVFEASMPSEWDVKTFSDPTEALDALDKLKPWVILSDQRMPSVTGVRYLELAKKIHPHAVRIIVTGYSAEDLVVESVKKAQVFDYIKKPWDPDELEASLRRAVDFYRVNQEARELTVELQNAHQREVELRKELECWVPPFLLWALKENELRFPLKRDIVGLAFDIVGSHHTHKFVVNGRPLRSSIIQIFSEMVLKNGGWRESTSGDSAYAHFGLWNETINPYESALTAAQEFRIALKKLCKMHGVDIECGLSLHVARESIVDVHMVQLMTQKGPVVQKSFDTTSIDIDLLHKIEKLVHDLPGTNIIMSEEFLSALKKSPEGICSLGSYKLPGDFKAVDLFLLKSEQVNDVQLTEFKKKFSAAITTTKKAA